MSRIPEYAWPDLRRVTYGEDRAMFVPVCPECGRFVKADKNLRVSDREIATKPNATCARCGRVAMPFEGYV